MNKVRVYKLAKELKIDSRKILDVAHHLGIDIHVPSNWVSEDIANLIRAKYRTKSPPENQLTSLNKLPLAEAKSTQENIKRKYKVSESAIHRKILANQKVTSNDKPLQNNRKIEIVLESKKAKRIDGKGNCNKCGALIKTLWQYSRSNVGVVNLCSRCKPIVYGRSFGSVDALNMAEQGGLFERNRRKH